MRGDSRRDLYAKTLALCGLCVLAGAGAVVDYWPVGVRFPQAASTFEPHTAVLLHPLSVPESAPVFAPPSRPVPQVAARVAASIDATTVAVDELLATHFFAAPAAALELHEPIPPSILTLVRNDISDLGAIAVRLSVPEASAPHTELAGYAAPAEHRGDGFLTTAFKVTGTSIARTGMKTGASLADAMRAVGNVFRRALPGDTKD